MMNVITYILGICQAIAIGGVTFYEANRKSPVVFLWCTLSLMFASMHLFCIVVENSSYDENILNEASLFVILFTISYFYTRIIFTNKNAYIKKIFYSVLFKRKDDSDIKVLFYLFLGVILLYLCSFIFSSGGLFNTSWAMGRELAANKSYLNLSQVYITIYYALSGLPFVFLLKKNGKMAYISMFFILALAIITRNRVLVIPFFVSSFSYLLVRVQKISWRHFLWAIIGAVIVIYVVYGLRAFRHYGTLEEFFVDGSLIGLIDKINIFLKTDNGELGLRNIFYFFISENNNFQGFGEGATYIRMLMVYIPTKFSFGLKPDDFAQTMGTAIGMVKGGSTHPTLFGDCYANFGYLGCLMGIFWGCYANISDLLICAVDKKSIQLLMYCLFGSMYVIIGRGAVYNGFVFVAYGSLLLVTLLKLLKIRIKGCKIHL